jgi:hypothetical protein
MYFTGVLFLNTNMSGAVEVKLHTFSTIITDKEKA